MKHKYGCLMVCRNEADWAEFAIKQIDGIIDVIAVVRGLTSWRNGFTNLDETDQIIKGMAPSLSSKLIYTEVEKPESDEAHRNICLDILRQEGCQYVLILDFDEFYHYEDLVGLLKWVDSNKPGQVGEVYCHALAYWKGMGYRCGVERFGPILIECRKDTRFDYIRAVLQKPTVKLPITLHHMTAVKTDAQMEQKILGWSHSHEVVDRWLENKWHAWDANRHMCDLHPVSPKLWPKAVPVPRELLPAILHRHKWFNRDVVR